MKVGENMTDEEKKEYSGELVKKCMTYCHIDYDDDEDIVELMVDTALEEMEHLIPKFDRFALTSRQKILVMVTVKELYDNREKYKKETTTLTNAVSSMLLKEMYGGETS